MRFSPVGGAPVGGDKASVEISRTSLLTQAADAVGQVTSRVVFSAGRGRAMSPGQTVRSYEVRVFPPRMCVVGRDPVLQ
jgi:molybdopterin-guanine dinucleotide biosynthesis protein A